jgi:autotransporter-associated beta strand protein
MRSRLHVRLRGNAGRWLLCVVLVVTSLASVTAAHAQSLWTGGTANYNDAANWFPPIGAPVAAGRMAVFDASGSTTVNVTSSSIAPDSWTFNSGAQSYTVSGGAVNFSLAGPFGGIIDNANSGQTITIANNIGESTAGVQVQQLGASTLVLSGVNTYTGGTTVSGFGTVQVTNNSSVGTGTVTLQDGQFQAGATANIGNNFRINNTVAGSAIDANGFALTISGNISDGSGGAGKLTIFDSFGGGAVTNEGVFNLVNANTAGITSITNQFGSQTNFFNATTAGNAVITTNSGGVVQFFDNSTGGNAQFITNGTGFVDFSQSSGPIGNGVITAGSIAGSGTYFIGGGNLLVVGSNNLSTEVSGVIDDGCCSSGNLEKVGTGTLTLSGTNTYTGVTFVNGGSLLVTGSIASSAVVLVDNGATLGGTGIVPQTALSGGATLAPGLPNALGTLTVNDLLSFCGCTFYDVKVTSAGNDLTRVVAGLSIPGVASLAGTVQVTSLNSSYKFNSSYTILTAQGGFGSTQFDSLITPTGINGSLSYTSTNVNLTLLSALGQLPGLNVNQRNVANVLDFGFNTTGSSGGLGAIFNGNILQNLTQVSGELPTGAQQATFEAMNLFLGLLTDPFIAGRSSFGAPAGGPSQYAEEDDGVSAYAKKANAAQGPFAKIPTKADGARNDLLDPRWSVWGSAFGGGATTSGNPAVGSNDTTARAFGFVTGADYRISPVTLVGFALGGGGTSFAVNGSGFGRSDLFQAGAFVRRNFGAAYVTGALAYGFQDVTTDRTVTVAGADHLHAQFNANAVSGRVEGGYRFATPWLGVTPYAAAQFTTFDLPAYTEQALSGAGTFAVNYAAKDVTDSRTELGLRLDRSYAMQSAILTLRGRIAWAHDFNTDRNIQAVFQTLPGASFVVNGAAQAADSALMTASTEVRWLNGWSAAATFEGEFSAVTSSFAGKGVVRYVW